MRRPQKRSFFLILAGEERSETVLNAFAGTTRVSQKRRFRSVHTVVLNNDLAAWSAVFASCYLLNEHTKGSAAQMIAHLNGLAPLDGWFTREVSTAAIRGMGIQSGLMAKETHVAASRTRRRLDAIRAESDRLQISPIERSVLLTSLIRASTRWMTRAGSIASYLNDGHLRSYKQLLLKVPSLLRRRTAFSSPKTTS